MKGVARLVVPAVLVLLALAAARASAAPGASAAPRACPPPVTLKILVNKDGWYRTTVDTTCFPASNQNIHLSTGGQEVAFVLLNDGTLEFYGQGPDTPTTESLYTDSRTYWLSVGSTPGLRMEPVPAGATPGTPTGKFDATMAVRDRKYYFSSVVNGPANNIFGDQPIMSGTTASRPLVLSNVEPAHAGTLRVDLHGFSAGAHNVTVALNGTPLGSVTGSGLSPMSATLTVPANTLVNGQNTVSMSTTLAGDTSYTDTFVLTYPHAYVADGDTLDFTVTPNQPVTVGGFSTSDVRVVDITDPMKPRVLIPTVSQGPGPYRVGITPPANATRLYAFTNANALAPKQVLQDSPSNLKATTNQADLIVIAHADFKNAVQPLVALRTGEGLAVDLVDVEDVYDEFAFGAHGPDAIRAFLEYAKTTWANPKPKYVLLVGDATFDPRNYLGHGNHDFVPTAFVTATFAPEPPSDESLADFNGDALAELAVGRLPAQNATEATAMVTKIVNYAGAPSRAKTALLVSDNHDRNDYPFRSFSDDLQNANLVPNGVSVTRVDRKDTPTPADDQQKHDEVVAEASKGPVLVNWFGHGGINYWAGSPPLLTRNDASTLQNAGALSLYMMMTCQNALFVDPTLPSLGEALLRAPNGAIAVWGSSGDTTAYPQLAAAKVATDQLFGPSGGGKRLGDAMLVAKAAVTDRDVRHTWTLLGDPTTRLKLSGPTSVALKSFTAAPGGRGVVLRWRTATEARVAGFNVYRLVGSKQVRLNRGLISAKHSGTARGAAYRLVDSRPRAATATYRLQIVGLSGDRTWAAATTLRRTAK